MDDEIILTGGDPAFKDGNIPGAVFRDGDCGHLVMLAPSSVKMLEANPGIKVLCIPCTSFKAVAEGGGKPYVTKEQLAELAEHLPVNEINGVMSLLEQMGFQVVD